MAILQDGAKALFDKENSDYFKGKFDIETGDLVYGEIEIDPPGNTNTGPCKDCGGGGGALATCVPGLGKSICVKVDPNIDINWGWPPSGGVSGGTITITINF